MEKYSTSSANADESHALPKSAHVSKSFAYAATPPSIPRMASGGEDSSQGGSED